MTTEFRPTPNRQSGYFSIVAEDTIDAPASRVFETILDLENYGSWSTYATKATKQTQGPVVTGDTIIFCIHLDTSKPCSDTPDTVLLVEDLPERKRFVVASSPLPSWLLWAEKVQQIEHVSDTQCRVTKWISMGGPIAPLDRHNKRKALRSSQYEVDVQDDSNDEMEVNPKRSKLSARRGNSESETKQGSDDEEDDLDFTQREPVEVATQSMSQVYDDDDNEPTSIANMNSKTKEDLLAKTVRYLLYKASAFEPVKLPELRKAVFPGHQNVTRYFLGHAARKLETIFGYKAVAVDDFVGGGSGKKDVFLIVNSIADQSHLIKVNKFHGKKERGLLMMIFGFIWCAPARRLEEDKLWKNLTLLDKSIRDKKHPVFGDLTLLLKAFESQTYLTSDSEIDPDGKRVKFYMFGPRAMAEVGKAQILTFVCKLINGRHPSKELLAELEHEDSQE
ncbi:unnamed protein product [Aphanomyces euteiches]